MSQKKAPVQISLKRSRGVDGGTPTPERRTKSARAETTPTATTATATATSTATTAATTAVRKNRFAIGAAAAATATAAAASNDRKHSTAAASGQPAGVVRPRPPHAGAAEDGEIRTPEPDQTPPPKHFQNAAAAAGASGGAKPARDARRRYPDDPSPTRLTVNQSGGASARAQHSSDDYIDRPRPSTLSRTVVDTDERIDRDDDDDDRSGDSSDRRKRIAKSIADATPPGAGKATNIKRNGSFANASTPPNDSAAVSPVRRKSTYGPPRPAAGAKTSGDAKSSKDEKSAGARKEVIDVESGAAAATSTSSSAAAAAAAGDDVYDDTHLETAVHRAELHGCRLVTEYERMNTIDEGTYGVVHRAKDKTTGEVVALKKIKMDKGYGVFPITSLREINILLSINHPNVVKLKEIVTGESLDDIYMVMEYMEHDLKALMTTMKQPFRTSEVKCLLKQLLSATDAMHQHWILHRDLKTSNLLMSNRGILKVCDFGLARRYGDPIGNYTELVVTLWYRAPELLLGTKTYGPAIDMWSVGCIFYELVMKAPMIPAKMEMEMIKKMFELLGTPKASEWPGLNELPHVKRWDFLKKQHASRLRDKIPRMAFAGTSSLSDLGFDLLSQMLCYNPAKRITAAEALKHPYFNEQPIACDPAMMPTHPSGNEGRKRRGDGDGSVDIRAKRESEAGGFFLA